MKGQMRRQDVVLVPARDQLTRSLREARRTGFLSLPAKNLTEFPPQVYHLDEHMEKDEKKWECVDLLRIDLSHNAIQEFSDEIASVNTLIYMKMCQNTLKSIPKGFFELNNLTFVDFSKNQLSGALSDHFSRLVNLKELILSSNQITELPSSIGLLEQLEALRIEENALTNLPESIGQLTRLHTLTAHTNALVSLPVSFSRLNNLSNLDLKKNSLTSFCDQQLATLSNLKFLDLRQNKLVVFPLLPKGSTLDQVFLGYNQLSELNEESILRVKDSITVFDIRDNKLSNLPAKLACLFKLKTLDLSNNDLSDLPPGLGYLKNLNHILIDGNPLRAIRRSILTAGCESLKKYLRTRGSPPKGVDVMEEEVDELEYLRREKQAIDGCKTPRTNIENDISIYRDAAATGTLDLSGRQWKELPIEITTQPFGTMETTLLHLNFSKNTLSHLPSELIRLIHLKTLIVEENRLQNLDPLIASQMKHLQFLRLKKNYLNSHVIDHFFQHTKGNKGLSQSLKELDLRNNQLIEMPMSLRFLQALDTLQLSYNQLKTLDGFPFHELRMTATISLSDNKLISLGKIYETPLLQSISFENNNITQVPCELGLCPHLKAIYLNGNPQKTVRGALIVKGSLEILLYLKNKFPPGTKLAPPSDLQDDDRDHDETDRSMKSKMPFGSVPVQAALSGGETPPQTTRRKSRLIGFAADGVEDDEADDHPKAYSTTSRQTHLSAKLKFQHVPSKEGNSAKYQYEEENALSSQVDDDFSSIFSELEQKIEALEKQLENHSLSAPKRYALKKELAMLRSTKIRQEREQVRK